MVMPTTKTTTAPLPLCSKSSQKNQRDSLKLKKKDNKDQNYPPKKKNNFTLYEFLRITIGTRPFFSKRFANGHKQSSYQSLIHEKKQYSEWRKCDTD